MIAEMVIAVTYADIEGNTTEEFLQVSLYIGTVLNNEVNYIQIAVSSSCIISITQSQQGHSGCKMNTFAIVCSIETL